MSHKDGRVVLSAWVEPVLRDYAREAAICCPPQRTAGGMGGIDAGGVL